jgi:tRNA(adenine34) deaminase
MTPETIWDAVMEQARLAMHAGEVPVGGVVVHDGAVLVRAHNQMQARGDATAHVEMLLIQGASAALGSKCLDACDLYVSLEPCAMCAGAIAHTRIRRLYFGAYDVKAGAVENGVRLFQSPHCHHRPEIYGGFRAAESAELLQQFFAQRR